MGVSSKDQNVALLHGVLLCGRFLPFRVIDSPTRQNFVSLQGSITISKTLNITSYNNLISSMIKGAFGGQKIFQIA